MIVGFAFLVVVVIVSVGRVADRDDGILGLDAQRADEPLPEFAVPVASGQLEGDANVFQDDCDSDRLPCPAGARRTPACDVEGADVIRVCDFFDRPLVLSFWFTRGGDDCTDQQDVVSEVSRRYRGRVGFLSLNVRDDRGSVRDLVRERGWRMAVGYDRDGAVANIYRIGGCPTLVYAYPGGILESTGIGELGPGGLSRRVDSLLTATLRKQRTAR